MTMENKTPYAVICKGVDDVPMQSCGKVYLSETEYTRQLSRPNKTWRCPNCGGDSVWDDDTYEAYIAARDELAPTTEGA